jgi:hypothetical protein
MAPWETMQQRKAFAALYRRDPDVTQLHWTTATAPDGVGLWGDADFYVQGWSWPALCQRSAASPSSDVDSMIDDVGGGALIVVPSAARRAPLSVAELSMVNFSSADICGVVQLWSSLNIVNRIDLGQSTLDHFVSKANERRAAVDPSSSQLKNDELPVTGATWADVLSCMGDGVTAAAVGVDAAAAPLLAVVPMRIDGNVVVLQCWSERAMYVVSMLTS